MRIRLGFLPVLFFPLLAADSTPRVTFLVRMGEHATQQDTWDGSARIDNGRLVNTVPWHFSASESITAPGAWKAVVVNDPVAPYADPHYTEMRGGETPPTLYHASGVYLTFDTQPGSHISIDTAQGNFSFSPPEITEQPRDFLGGRATVVGVPTAEKLTDDLAYLKAVEKRGREVK